MIDIEDYVSGHEEDEDDDIDHEYTNEIVCPFCGYEFGDSWECGSDNEDMGLIECGNCDKEFYATRNVEVTYCTYKATYGTCKHCKTEDIVIDDYHSTMGRYDGLCERCGEKEKHFMVQEYFKKLDELKKGENI